MLRSFAVVVTAIWAFIAPPTLTAQDQPENHGVRPGDQVVTDFYTASGDLLESVRGTRLVDRDGNVFFPYVGSVHVDGLDAQQLRSLLVERFEPFYNDPVITVNVLLRVNITGVVSSPGHYFFDPTTTVLDALSEAGGVGAEISVVNAAAADASAVRLVRNGRTTILDLRPENPDQETLEMSIRSGDWLHVPFRQRSRIRDDVQFWGGLLSLFTSAVAAVILIAR